VWPGIPLAPWGIERCAAAAQIWRDDRGVGDMEVRFKYGRGGVTLDLPEDRVLAVCRANDLPGVPALPAEIERALRNPIGSPPLESLAGG